MKIIVFSVFLLSIGIIQIGQTYSYNDYMPFYMASLRTTENVHYCDGVILTPEWILTAAACVGGMHYDSIKIIVGIDKIKSGIEYWPTIGNDNKDGHEENYRSMSEENNKSNKDDSLIGSSENYGQEENSENQMEKMALFPEHSNNLRSDEFDQMNDLEGSLFYHPDIDPIKNNIHDIIRKRSVDDLTIIPLNENQIYDCDYYKISPDLQDLALIKLKKSINNQMVATINLNLDLETKDGERLSIFSWGLFTEDQNLQRIDVTCTNGSICTEQLGTTFDGKIQLCLTQNHNETEELRNCQSYGGSPVINEDNLLTGIMSYGLDCRNEHPMVSTKVSEYIRWIQKEIAGQTDNNFSILEWIRRFFRNIYSMF